MRINKDTLIGDILKINSKAVEVLMAHGMGCIGCPSAQMETLEQAAGVHGIDLENLLRELNKGIE